MSFPTLTLAIPTYNRRPKLERLLKQVSKQTEELSGFPRLQVLISNNHSTDDTPEFLEGFEAKSFDLRVVHQPVNIGGCRNHERLHRESVTDYTWIFSDDDLLLPGALRKIWTALNRERPDLLRFSFIQPLGNPHPLFNFKEAVYATTDKAEISRLAAKFTKISSFVHKNALVPPMDPIFHSAHGCGWMWLSWAYAVLAQAPNPKMVVISESLASCDEEETNDGLRFTFVVWSQYPNVFKHPFVQTHAPELLVETERGIYSGWVGEFYNVRRGRTPASYFEGFAFQGRPPFVWRVLIREPMLLLKWVSSRLNVPAVYKLVESGVFQAFAGMPVKAVRRTKRALRNRHGRLVVADSAHPE